MPLTLDLERGGERYFFVKSAGVCAGKRPYRSKGCPQGEQNCISALCAITRLSNFLFISFHLVYGLWQCETDESGKITFFLTLKMKYILIFNRFSPTSGPQWHAGWLKMYQINNCNYFDLFEIQQSCLVLSCQKYLERGCIKTSQYLYIFVCVDLVLISRWGPKMHTNSWGLVGVILAFYGDF